MSDKMSDKAPPAVSTSGLHCAVVSVRTWSAEHGGSAAGPSGWTWCAAVAGLLRAYYAALAAELAE